MLVWPASVPAGLLMPNPALAFLVMASEASPVYVVGAFGSMACLIGMGIIGIARSAKFFERPEEAASSNSPGQMVSMESEKAEGATPAPLWQLPVFHQWAHPVINLEITRASRFHAPSLWVLLLTVPQCVLFYLAVFLPLHFSSPVNEHNEKIFLLIMQMAGFLFAAAILLKATLSWNKEIKSGNAVHLRMLGLSALEVVLAKIAGILLAACPFLLLLVPTLCRLAMGLSAGFHEPPAVLNSFLPFAAAPTALCAGAAFGVSAEKPGTAVAGSVIFMAVLTGLSRPLLDRDWPDAPGQFVGLVILAWSGLALFFVVWTVMQFDRVTGE